MYGNLSEERIEHVLSSQLLGRIGCYANNRMYIVPICYAYHGNCIYGRTFEGLKLKMMRENPQVCFQLEHLESMGHWQSVICWGEFEELTEMIKRNNGIRILQNRVSVKMDDENLRISHYWPFSINETDDIEGIIFCIHISEKTGKFEKV